MALTVDSVKIGRLEHCFWARNNPMSVPETTQFKPGLFFVNSSKLGGIRLWVGSSKSHVLSP